MNFDGYNSIIYNKIFNRKTIFNHVGGVDRPKNLYSGLEFICCPNKDDVYNTAWLKQIDKMVWLFTKKMSFCIW